MWLLSNETTKCTDDEGTLCFLAERFSCFGKMSELRVKNKFDLKKDVFIQLSRCVLFHFSDFCVYTAADLGVDVNLCEREVTAESSGEFLTPSRHGPGSVLQTLVNFLSETHNSLVRKARRMSGTEDRSVQHQLQRLVGHKTKSKCRFLLSFLN